MPDVTSRIYMPREFAEEFAGSSQRIALRDLGYGPEGPTILYLDSKSAIDLAFDAVRLQED